MHFLREHLNSKCKKLKTNYSASKAKTCQCSGKNLGLLIPVFNKKCLIFSLCFSFICIFAKTCVTNTQFNFFYQNMLLLTKVKQFSNLLNIKKKCVLLLLLDILCPDSKIMSLKHP